MESLLPNGAKSDDPEGGPKVAFADAPTEAEANFDALPFSEKCVVVIRNWVALRVPWRLRLIYAALVVGLLCGVVACAYIIVMDYILEKVWAEAGPAYAAWAGAALGLPPWTYILIVCIVFGGLTGVLIRVFGEPMANLPGVVLAAHRDGLLGYEEAPAMAVISLSSITAAGSLGPEAPLVSIGGGLASFVARFIDLSEAETLFVTMCGMGAGLAAFFGEPVGGAIFACEVIHRYGLEYYEAVVPTVIAGLACNWSFRVMAGLPQQPIWTFAPEPLLLPWTSILGLAYGALGGILGWGWMRFTNTVREKVLVPLKLGPKHIVKGLIGGTIIGTIGVLLPQTLFWAEFEAQAIIDGARRAPARPPHRRRPPAPLRLAVCPRTPLARAAAAHRARAPPRCSQAGRRRCRTSSPASARSATSR